MTSDKDQFNVSWNGFNVFCDDKKSQEEVLRLIHLEGRLQWFEKQYAKDHKIDKA